MNILYKIDKLRIEKGWSVYKLAEESDLTYSTISNMFVRKSNPSIATLEALCKGLGISMAEFFAEEKKDVESVQTQELVTYFEKLSDKNKQAVINLIKELE